MKFDLTYSQDKIFTRFYAETKEGENAWNEMANKLGGTAAVLNCHASDTLTQLRKAGYKVGKAKFSNMSIDEILAQLDK